MEEGVVWQIDPDINGSEPDRWIQVQGQSGLATYAHVENPITAECDYSDGTSADHPITEGDQFVSSLNGSATCQTFTYHASSPYYEDFGDDLFWRISLSDHNLCRLDEDLTYSHLHLNLLVDG